MKKLMQLAFAISNPEDTFENSDYYPFVQRLFVNDSKYSQELAEFKHGLTVISFNYDCYLDFLLLRAATTRGLTDEESRSQLTPYFQNQYTSGFFRPTSDFAWAGNTTHFNYFKLHGSIAYGDCPDFGYKTLFGDTAEERLRFFNSRFIGRQPPPIVFPWELFDGKAQFIADDDFVFVKEAKDARQREESCRLFAQFQAIWRGAQEAVENAHKISFVGLSFHDYLEEGFRFLFQNISSKKVQIVVANTSNRHYAQETAKLKAGSPCSKAASLLNRLASNLRWVKSNSENQDFTSEGLENTEEPDITARDSFSEFIRWEMD